MQIDVTRPATYALSKPIEFFLPIDFSRLGAPPHHCSVGGKRCVNGLAEIGVETLAIYAARVGLVLTGNFGEGLSRRPEVFGFLDLRRTIEPPCHVRRLSASHSVGRQRYDAIYEVRIRSK
jgi:hypothetical protein